MADWAKTGVAGSGGGDDYEFDPLQSPAAEMRLCRSVLPSGAFLDGAVE